MIMSFKGKCYHFSGRIWLDSTYELKKDSDANFKNWNWKDNSDSEPVHGHGVKAEENDNDNVYEFEDDFDIDTTQGQLCSLKFLLSSNSSATSKTDSGSSSSSLDKMQLRVCLPWGGKGTKMDSTYNTCLIKFNFLDEFQNVSSIRYVHIESSSGECDRTKTNHPRSPKEVATFHNPEFCSVEEMQRLCVNATYKNGKTYERIVADIEVIFKYPLVQSSTSASSSKRRKIVSESWTEFVPNLFDINYSPHPSYSDVVFKLFSENGEILQTFPAHKCVLAAASSVLHSMFNVNMEEKKSEIIVTDVSSEALAKFLTLIHSNTIGINNRSSQVKEENNNVTETGNSMGVSNLLKNRMALEVLKLADKYKVLDVREYCVGCIVGSPNSEFTLKIALDVYLAGSLYDIDDLCFRSCQWIRRNKSELKTDRGRKLLDGFMRQHLNSSRKCSSFLISLL